MKNYHKNPRQIKDRQFNDLRAWLAELGDLSGIVHDLNTDEVISGNQRMRAIDIAKCEIVLTEGPHEPDAQGTVAHGYVLWQGAKYNYRQVRWTPEQCEKANIVANKAGGGWDFDILANEWEKEDLLEWGFSGWELGLESEVDKESEWAGMPSFEQEDAFGAILSIKVHFAKQEDINAFAGLVGQTVSDKTKYIWYPRQVGENLKAFIAHDES